jgi:hypothetical protein
MSRRALPERGLRQSVDVGECSGGPSTRGASDEDAFATVVVERLSIEAAECSLELKSGDV